MRGTPSQRFWPKVNAAAPDECWEWKASHYSNGYGHFRLAGPQIGAHRAAWILTFGDIPEGLHVCHKCDNRGCVNPNHLWLGTIKQNYEDMVAKKRRVSSWARRTHCSRGHEYTPANTTHRRGARLCKACQAIYRRLHKEQKGRAA